MEPHQFYQSVSLALNKYVQNGRPVALCSKLWTNMLTYGLYKLYKSVRQATQNLLVLNTAVLKTKVLDHCFFFWTGWENHQYDESRPRCAKREWETVSDFY